VFRDTPVQHVATFQGRNRMHRLPV
jgi:hypothetical protein